MPKKEHKDYEIESQKLEYTGERIIPKEMNPRNGMLIEHVARYEFARDISRGRVLDIACGAGYGTEIICEDNPNIDEFVGIDFSEETIDYARTNYSYKNTNYYVDNALNEKLADKYGKFDTIISFETIEHFEGDELFVKNLYSLLKDDGRLIISTPLGRGKGEPCSCPFHVYQYKEEEFVDVLSPFSSLQMYHQINSTIEIPEPDKKYYLMLAICKK